MPQILTQVGAGLAGHWHEANPQEPLHGDGALVCFVQENEVLHLVDIAHRSNQPASRAKLFHQDLGNLWRRRSQDDRIKRSRFWPTPVTVALAKANVREWGKPRSSRLRQRGDNLNRKDFPGTAPASTAV